MISGERVPTSVLDTTIPEIMAKAGVTGLSVAIINDSKISNHRAFGLRNKDTEVLNNEDTIFGAASLSKTVAAYLVMLLVEDEIIDLNQPLEQYFDEPLREDPNYEDLRGDQRARRITARMALNHSTGFPNWRFLTNDGKLRIMFEPGSRFSYSGEGMNLLQKAVEETTGRGLEQLSQELVFEPLGMEHTSYVWQEKFEENHAVPHDRYERAKMLFRRREAEAAGSMQTTAVDYARFLLAIHNAKGVRKSSMNAMLDTQISINSENMSGVKLSWGLGWGRFDIEHGKAFFHHGHDLGWQNYTVTFLDRGISVVFLSNSDNFESVARELAGKTIGDVCSPFDWLGYPHYDPTVLREAPPEPVACDVSPDTLRKYIGEYNFLINKRFLVEMKDNQLYGSVDGETRIEMYSESESSFFMKGFDGRITFSEEADGQITGFTLHMGDLKLKGNKKLP